MRRVVILGSTGSIGTNALDVLRRLEGRFSVYALTAHRNVELLSQQAEEFKPRFIVIGDPALVDRLKTSGAKILAGPEGLEEVAALPEADIVLNALVGAVGLVPTLRALGAGKRVALANKETLVMGGELVMRAAADSDGELIPVDSEHSAIFQCLKGNELHDVKRLILTASGGPFLGLSPEELSSVSPREALSHPVWEMGRKVTIDSATLMNKGLEVIEAHWLFGVPIARIEVLIHQQSIVHSLVEYTDHSILAQMSLPDMKLPIQYALTYPHRELSSHGSLDLAQVGALTFQRPDPDRFPCFGLAHEAAEAGGAMPVVLNAANEVAVPAFLEGQIRFTDIPQVIEKTMAQHRLIQHPDLEEILATDAWARETAAAEVSYIERCRKRDPGYK
jgi:1-deoxy-D-xylulose-5-phosphate reductoisomerase